MRKLLTTILGMVSVLLMTACGDLETSGNGSFDGLWQLTQIDSLGNGMKIDMRERQIYWSVQGSMLDMRDHLSEKGDGHTPLIFRFEFVSDTLHIVKPYINYRPAQDPKPDSDATTSFYCLQGLEEAFLVRQLSSSKMVLETCREQDNILMYFRKY